MSSVVFHFGFSSFCSPSLLAEDKTAEKSLAEELPRIKAVEVKDALKTFAVQKGFHLELVAAEPDVSDPVDACFDENGRMYVAEMHGYPFSHEPTRLNPKGGGKYNAGIIRLLEDTDGDGRMDRSIQFADDITWPTSVCCYRGGLFVLAPPHIHYFKDTDGDGVADVREIVFTGFDRSNVQSLANNMKWTLENRIALAGGRNPGKLKYQGKEILSLGRTDLSFDPVTRTVTPITGGVQYGHSLDDWGNRFVCSNSNHIQHVVYPYRYLKRNPYFAVSGAIRSISAEGPASPVFRRSSAEPWRIVRTRRRVSDPAFKARLSYTEQFAIGFFTSATGVTIYRGSAYPLEYRGNAFIGDVGGNLIHRKTVQAKGASFVATRADQNAEFIASTDNWFRPVNFVNAPDGTLYILDMYRETIEHPHSIPQDMKEHLFLESGDDRGRIYRLMAPNTKRISAPKLGGMTSVELVRQLESGNAWNRETAQRLLWERQDPAAVSTLEALVKSSKVPPARLHALYTLDGLSALKPNLLLHALQDASAGIREHAVRLSEKHLDSSPELVKTLAAMTNDPSHRVRFQLAFSLGETSHEDAVRGLARLARNNGNDADIRTALLTSVHGKADRLAVELIRDAEFSKRTEGIILIGELAKIIGAGNKSQPALKLLAAVTALPDRLDLQQRVLQSLGRGLSRRGSSVTKLLSEKSAEEIRGRIQELFQRAVETAGNQKRSLNDRTVAIRLLAFADYQTAAKHLPKYLSPQVPQRLQLAAVEALADQKNDRVGKLLLAEWRGYSPKVRRDVVDALLSSTKRIDALFAAVESKQVQRSEIERDKKQLLLNHPNANVRSRSRKLFGNEVSSDRAKVVAAYQKTLDLEGDIQRGGKLFEKNCSICHKVGDKGHQVGPDFASVLNKSDADLIISILDPNREAQPNFTSYTLITQQGRIHTGIITAETATSITLRRAEGKQDVILRSNIDMLVSSGKSIMPEGLEKDISPQQLADLLKFIRTIKPVKK
ncbi:MAG: c-type cytochrome [Planctomycetes bacterium]|nr:c-type cytochrome [Planctomycetota bacterium]